MNNNTLEQIKTMERYDKKDIHFEAINLVKKGSKVYSVGCGAGREVSYLVNELKCEVTACDVDDKMIRLSKKKCKKAEYILGDFVDQYPSGRYDYVLMLWNVINYSSKSDRKKMIEKAYNVLKSEGILIITTRDITQNWRFIFHNIKHMVPYYYFPSQIGYWFKDTSFVIDKIEINKNWRIVAKKL